ncbi:hypothetical protein JJL45_14285 [Tamlana sp. s12]|uniref:hypothetical protein n=1 Tax=Tamlana sp. s12 TaxID=1630406 RepID=UPI000AAECD65|nr:hypothetical protein [Tamlana sp. s12]QQY82076.1 hypothetical protein JJL45_14285 [Tamlana sp. s12]
MKLNFVFLCLLVLNSCGNEKVLELPEINHSEISEINDVSPGYLFYDETQTDSIELNRKNLIVSTNWLINVDKRLSLKQVIPKIKFLQDKKNNSSHKNENARNYYTCHDLSRKTLGFIDFTDVVYTIEDSISNTTRHQIIVRFDNNDNITVDQNDKAIENIKSNSDDLFSDLNKIYTTGSTITLCFHEDLSFQDYIDYKTLFQNKNSRPLKFSKKEFLYN